MHDNIEKYPRLHRVVNLHTQEVFTLFAKSKEEAVSLCPIGCFDDIEVTEIKATLDGSEYSIFQLRNVPVTFFKTVNCNTLKVGKTVWIKKRGDYDPSTRKYCCIAAEDISKSREFKPAQWVITTFTY